MLFSYRTLSVASHIRLLLSFFLLILRVSRDGNVFGQVSGQLRLVGGSYPTEGRVEIYMQSEWGTICNDNFGMEEARVVCRQLGYEEVIRFPSANLANSFGQGSGRIWLNEVDCTGTEDSILQCSYAPDNFCGHVEDVGVVCGGNIRLVGGNSRFEGRVEIFLNGGWGTICDDRWEIEDAQVVCNQLGYTDGAVEFRRQAFFGEGTDTILITNVACSGEEMLLANCTYEKVTPASCDHSEDAGVVCPSVTAILSSTQTGTSSTSTTSSRRDSSSNIPSSSSRTTSSSILSTNGAEKSSTTKPTSSSVPKSTSSSTQSATATKSASTTTQSPTGTKSASTTTQSTSTTGPGVGNQPTEPSTNPPLALPIAAIAVIAVFGIIILLFIVVAVIVIIYIGAQHKVTYAVEAPRSARDFQTDPRQKVLNWSLEHSFAEAEDYTLHETNYSKQGEIQL